MTSSIFILAHFFHALYFCRNRSVCENHENSHPAKISRYTVLSSQSNSLCLEYPSCLQATLASTASQPLSHTVPHALLWQTSTCPSFGRVPPTSLMIPSGIQAMIKQDLNMFGVKFLIELQFSISIMSEHYVQDQACALICIQLCNSIGKFQKTNFAEIGFWEKWTV